MATIEIAGLGKAFGTTPVLRGIDLSIADGAFVVVLGASGCGKSTLLRTIAGLEVADAGTIRIDGRDVAGLEPRDRGCAMVFQNYALYPHMSVERNIGYGLRVARVARVARRERVRAAARLVELEEHLDRKPAQLSGGQRQRVAMARAIVREPAVFLFDEPLSNLDARLRVQMRQEIRAIHDRIGATSVFVTHDQVEGLTLADELVVMRDGRIEQRGPPDVVYARPRTAFVARFLGAPGANVLPARVENGLLRLAAVGEPLAALPGHPDADLLLGIRPEDVVINPRAPLAAQIVGFENLGPMQVFHVRVGGHALAVLVASGAPGVGRDGALRLGFPAHALHLFDPVTEVRMDLRPEPLSDGAIRTDQTRKREAIGHPG